RMPLGTREPHGGLEDLVLAVSPRLHQHSLAERQVRIEEGLARRHLRDGELVLYDVSSSYFEGHTCALAQLWLLARAKARLTTDHLPGCCATATAAPWRSRCRRLLARQGACPSRSASSPGASGSPRSWWQSIAAWSQASIEALRSEGVDWITALKAPKVKKLIKDRDLQLSLSDQQNLAEITSDDYPGQRLVVCRNPLVGVDRSCQREELLAASERDLEAIMQRIQAGILTGQAQIALEVGRSAQAPPGQEAR